MLFHTTGGSDEGQDWELAKVGAYVWSQQHKQFISGSVKLNFEHSTSARYNALILTICSSINVLDIWLMLE